MNLFVCVDLQFNLTFKFGRIVRDLAYFFSWEEWLEWGGDPDTIMFL